MNKLHVYKSLGIIEAYFMFLSEKLDAPTSDYVMTHLDLLQKWVDESCIDERHTTPIDVLCGYRYKQEISNDDDSLSDHCPVIKAPHLYLKDVCCCCGKVKDDKN